MFDVSILKEVYTSIKDDVKELVKVFFVSAIFCVPFHLAFKEWSLTIIFFILWYGLLLNSSYIVSIDKKLREKGVIK